VVAGKRRLFVLDYYGSMTPPKRLKLPTLLLALAMSTPLCWAQVEAPVNSELNSSLLYELLLSEISANNGDANSAYQLMLDAAQKSRSEQLYERAVEIALRARAGDSALQAAQAWTRATPSSNDARRYLLQILIGLNKLPDTVEPVKRELAGMQPKERLEAIKLVPRYFVRATDKALAAKVVELALTPELANLTTGPAAYAAIGTMRLLAGDGDGALEAAKKGATLNPKAQEPLELALALMESRLPGAEALITRRLSVGASPELRMAYVRKLLDAQRYADAQAQTLQLTAISPEFADGWLVLGTLFLQDKQSQLAQSALEKYVSLKTTNPGNSDEKTDRGLTQAYLLLAQIAEQDQRLDVAERYLALIINPQDALRAQSHRAAILARQGKLDEARALIRAVPEVEPEDARAKISAEVQLLRDNKQFDLVYKVLQEAVETNPQDTDLQYDLAMAAEKLDRIAEMEKLLRQVIADKPDYHQAYNALGYSLADRKMRLPEARELIEKALEFAPNDPFIQDSLGWVEFRSGNLNKAEQILQAAYQSRPDPEIAAHLGEVLWSMGQQAQARTIWKAGTAQNPDNESLRETIRRLETQ
jgi:tetratricopeptide (TPR) repeat protein